MLKNVLPILSPGSFIVLHLKLMVGEAGPEAAGDSRTSACILV